MFVQRVLVEQLKRLYEEAEAHKLSCWAVLTELEDEMEWSGELTQEEKTLDAEASYDGKVLKIVINDLLPRGCNVKSGMMRAYWIRNIIRAVKRLNTPVSFEKALCVIKMFIPRVGEWDVDNFPVVIKTFADGQLLRVELWAAGLPEGDYRAAFFAGKDVAFAGGRFCKLSSAPFVRDGVAYAAGAGPGGVPGRPGGKGQGSCWRHVGPGQGRGRGAGDGPLLGPCGAGGAGERCCVGKRSAGRFTGTGSAVGTDRNTIIKVTVAENFCARWSRCKTFCPPFGPQ